MAKAVFEYKGILIEQEPNSWIVKVPVQGKGNPNKKQKYDIGYYGNRKAALNFASIAFSQPCPYIMACLLPSLMRKIHFA